MITDFEEKAWLYLKDFKRISPCGLMRKFKVTYEFAEKICLKVYLRQHLEARAFAKELEERERNT